MNSTQRIYWFIISQSCTNLPYTVENFDLINQFGSTILRFGRVYTSYARHVELSPERVFDVSSADVQVYLDWIQKLHDSFQSVRRQFSNGNYTYNDTIKFNQVSKLLKQISDIMFANPLDFVISDMKSIFDELLRKIENLLVLHSEYNNGSVMLHHLLEHYHVSIPQTITNNFFLPSTSEHRASEKDGSGRPLKLIILPEDNLTLRQLEGLKKEVDEFVKPISECLKTALLFLGHPCQSFKHYYDLFLRKEAQLPKPNEEITVDTFKKVLFLTTKALIDLCGGKVQYSELPLEQEGISDVEFDILLLFSKLHQCSSEGLSSIRSMAVISHLPLQLQTMKKVFDQYGLKHCHDPNFLKAIEESERMQLDKLTIKPLEAGQRLKHIESLLHCSFAQLRGIVRLFESVADSAPFYQFVMDRKLYGLKGKELFQQKYELLTAQLQHEEYDDAVLNHLYAAYRIILLFLDTDQDTYETFMSNVLQLDVANGLKQLQTVNENITLIQVWFSRVEVINNAFDIPLCKSYIFC